MGPRVLGFRPGISINAQDLVKTANRQQPKEPMTGSFLYVLRGDHNMTKIGVSTNPIARLAQLRTASAFPIDFAQIFVTPGNGFDIEHNAHELLSKNRCHGEWFDVPPEMAVAAISGAAHKLGQPLQPLTVDQTQQVLQIVQAGGFAPTQPKTGFRLLRWTAILVFWLLAAAVGSFVGLLISIFLTLK